MCWRKKCNAHLLMLAVWLSLDVISHVVAVVDDTEIAFMPWDQANEAFLDDNTFLYQTFGDSGRFHTEPRYIVLASKYVRPGQVYRVSVTILSSPLPLVVRASLQRDTEEIAADSTKTTAGYTNTLLME
ncbi:uncharacterized protein LOC111088262, partial [Limulus polyphemus]|uniref:Uncharacterized protein LOC111088262 n=1 Tax=Limulus polyphemus TaxID=6850 RepID=A0ABM1TCF0_LIMPO